MPSLVGSEMCIRDRYIRVCILKKPSTTNSMEGRVLQVNGEREVKPPHCPDPVNKPTRSISSTHAPCTSVGFTPGPLKAAETTMLVVLAPNGALTHQRSGSLTNLSPLHSCDRMGTGIFFLRFGHGISQAVMGIDCNPWLSGSEKHATACAANPSFSVILGRP